MWSQSCDILNPYEALKEPDERKPLTNGDYVRSLNDEALACWAACQAGNIGKQYTDSFLGLLDWLKQPMEGEEPAYFGNIDRLRD